VVASAACAVSVQSDRGWLVLRVVTTTKHVVNFLACDKYSDPPLTNTQSLGSRRFCFTSMTSLWSEREAVGWDQLCTVWVRHSYNLGFFRGLLKQEFIAGSCLVEV
jgi:hypothetical protein